jgi:YegS/Rv2252/BmrU family lipid kinase
VSSYTFIVNPAAGKGSGAKLPARLARILDGRGVSYKIVQTTGPGHATELARSADTPAVISVGGDGTLNEVTNGLAGSDKAVGVVPAGSGNDFIKSAGIPRGLEASVEKCLSGKILTVDVGTAFCGESPVQGRLFLNGIGIGFDAAVAVRTKQIRFLTGTALYMLAVFQTLARYTNPMMSVSIDGKTTRGKHLLIAVGNGVCAGGGFYLTPRASITDGLLDFCSIGDVRIGRILRLMPLVLWGKHVNKTDVVSYVQGKALVVESEEPFYVHADGEIIGERVKKARIELDARKLKVLV